MFKKIFAGNLLILFITFAITSGSLFGIMRSYVIDKKQASLLQYAREIRDLTAYVVEYGTTAAADMFQRNLDAYSFNLQAAVFVISKDGKVVFASRLNESPAVGTVLQPNQYEDVVKGQTVQKLGTLEGLFDTMVLTIGIPLPVNGSNEGAVFICSPMPEVNQLLYDVFLIFLISVLISMGVAFIVMYIVSNKLSQPIKKMKRAAEDFASGKFETRIEITSDDEIGELARAFNDMTDALDNLEKNRRSFVADVSHELRTPMTTIAGFVEGILDGTITSDRQNEYLRVVLSETKRLTRLVNDLLYAERYRDGQGEFQPSVFDINELIRVVLIGFEKIITEKNIDVEICFCDETTQVEADRDSIQRVITNLVDNAVKFANPGGEISINVRMEGQSVSVSVRNTGEVIAPVDLKHIFDRFYKTDKSRGINKNGVGLGLHIVQSIIARHGQSITASSDLKNGTVFTFTLPYKK